MAEHNLKFREDWGHGHVRVINNGIIVYRNRDYRTAAEWAQKKYNLSDSELITLYYDYKEDYDS